jgi:hypothetical protein
MTAMPIASLDPAIATVTVGDEDSRLRTALA